MQERPEDGGRHNIALGEVAFQPHAQFAEVEQVERAPSTKHQDEKLMSCLICELTSVFDFGCRMANHCDRNIQWPPSDGEFVIWTRGTDVGQRL